MSNDMNAISAALTSPSDGKQSCAMIAHNESERLRAVRRCEILDTPPDSAIDRITALAAHIYKVPIAIVSIVDSDRIWFKSRYGLDLRQVPRDPGLCASAILGHTPWIVTDATLDPRTQGHPLVTGQYALRSYAAALLTTTDGHNVGTLCVIDKHPRSIGETQIAVLQDLASMIMNEIELRVSLKQAWQLDDALLEQLLKAKQDAEHTAKHDALTGVGNRRKFDEAYSVEINRIQRYGDELCIMVLDTIGPALMDRRASDSDDADNVFPGAKACLGAHRAVARSHPPTSRQNTALNATRRCRASSGRKPYGSSLEALYCCRAFNEDISCVT